MSKPMLPDVPSRRSAIDRHKEAGGKIAAVLPIHAPRALLRAHGLLPVEVWGPPGLETSRGDAHLQAYTCSVVRSSLSFLESGGADVADVVLVPHACDSLQGLGSVLLDFVRPKMPVTTFYLPRGPKAASTAFLADELKALSGRLAEVSGVRPDDAALGEAVAREEAADRAFAELLDARPRLPFGDRDVYRVIRAREYLPAETFEPLARAALATAGDAPRPGLPLLMSGMLPEPMDVLDAVGDAGAYVAADDLASCGRRRYPAGSAADPWVRLAESLLGGPPDSTRGSPTAERLSWLLGLARRTGAKAVLFHVVKFCEPEQFYLPQLRKGLEAEGLPSVVVEVDVSDRLGHQAVTRLEALLETVA